MPGQRAHWRRNSDIELGALLSRPRCVPGLRGPPGTAKHAAERVLASLRMRKTWKNCKLDLPAAKGKEAALAEASGNQKLTGNKQEANGEKRVPFVSSRILQSLCCPLVAVWSTDGGGSESVVFRAPTSHTHKAKCGGAGLKLRDNSLITGTLNNRACQEPATMSNPIPYP